jgi:hypothetical protein
MTMAEAAQLEKVISSNVKTALRVSEAARRAGVELPWADTHPDLARLSL